MWIYSEQVNSAECNLIVVSGQREGTPAAPTHAATELQNRYLHPERMSEVLHLLLQQQFSYVTGCLVNEETACLRALISLLLSKEIYAFYFCFRNKM